MQNVWKQIDIFIHKSFEQVHSPHPDMIFLKPASRPSWFSSLKEILKHNSISRMVPPPLAPVKFLLSIERRIYEARVVKEGGVHAI